MEYEPPVINTPPPTPLSDGWRTVAFITWILTGASTAAIAITSRTIGRPIWWLGPESNPAPFFYVVLPLTCVVVPLYAASREPKRLPISGVVCSLVLLASALADIASSPAVAISCVIVSVLTLLVSISLVVIARQYR